MKEVEKSGQGFSRMGPLGNYYDLLIFNQDVFTVVIVSPWFKCQISMCVSF